MNPIRILYTVHQFYPRWYTGTEKFVLTSAKMQQQLSNEVKVVAYGLDPVSAYDQSFGNIVYKEFLFRDVPVVEFRSATAEGHLNEVLFDEQSRVFAERIIREYRPDVIHVGHPMRTCEFAHYARAHGIPIIYTLTDFWLFCVNYSMIRKNKSLCAGSSGGENCADICHPSREFCLWRHDTAKRMLLDAQAVISPSLFLSQMFEKEFPGLHVRVIPHGISARYLLPNRRIYSGRSHLTFCYTGSLMEHKGVHLLIGAFRKISDKSARLLIYGSGPEDYMRRLSGEAAGDKRIEFRGVYEANQIGSVLTDCDVVVVPSVCYENYPLTLHEALASRVPVIASNIGGMLEKIKDGVNGNTFEVGRQESLYEKMRDLIEYPEVLNTYKNNLLKFMVPSIEQEAGEYQKIFEGIQTRPGNEP